MDTTSAGMIGKYQVIRVLGRGGMGEVLLAQDDLGRRVAIKRPFKSALEDGLARFKLEAKASTLSHPNIPVVYEMGTQEGLPFIAMEFVEGDPLDKLISSGTPLDLITKLSIIEQVCAGLGHAHQKGIIHRDIKPANVILQPNGVAKILDWGIAKIQNLDQTQAQGLTQTSAIIGSLHYIAPERFKGEAIDGRVDVFSAGVMLYLLLTGQLPFAGGEATAAYRIVNEAHTSLGQHIRDYPPALDAIMDQALAKDPEDRYATAEDFADALHEVIEELKKTRVFQLFDDAERLTTESRFAPALELLDEAIKLDPANTQVRKLRRFVREHQERQRRAERLREYLVKADELLAAANYSDALAQLKEAQRMDATFPELAERILAVEEKKRRHDLSTAALAEAGAAKDRGDITAALRIADRAIQQDPENSKLLALRGALAKQAESEALQSKVLALIETARRELAAQHFPAVEQLLSEADAIDPSHPKIDELRREMARSREQEERRQLLDEIHRRVNEFLRQDNYDQAADLLNRAIDKLPTEATLHRLKVEVDTGARRYNSKVFIDGAISAAREKFVTAPLEALAGLQRAIEQMPGEERLLAYERSLRQQIDANRSAQLLADTLRKARELISDRQFDKAIGVLESYHLEFGNQADVDEMLALARNEQASKDRRTLVERTSAQVRTLIQSERLDDAVRMLESVIRDSGETSLNRLLEEVREQQTALARKLEVVQKRVALQRERGELDEAIRVLQEYLAATPNSPRIQELLAACQSESEQKQIVQQTIASAQQAASRWDFAAGLETLETVQRAYGDSAELTAEIQKIQGQRAAVANDAASKSIETARAALLKKDAGGALAALKESAPMLEFADQKRQADWQRIAKSAKDELRRTPTATNTAAIDQLNEIAGVARPAQARKSPVPMFVGIGVAVLAIGGGVWWMMRSRPKATEPEAQYRITKAPPGATLKVGDLAPVPVDANGNASLKLKPGTYHVVVSKPDFSDFVEDVDLAANENRADPAELTRTEDSGFLVVSAVGDDAAKIAKIKVYANGVFKGTVSNGGQLTLGAGPYRVHYSAVGFEDSADKQITISRKATTNDQYTLLKLRPPPPNVGFLTVSTNPSAQIVLDGSTRAAADANGKYTFEGLKPGTHFVDVSLDKYQSVAGKPVSVEAGKYASLEVRMELVPLPPSGSLKADQTTIEYGQTANLSWQVNNASSVALDGSTVNSSGTKPVTPDHTTTYQLSANNGAVGLGSVTITVRPKQPEKKPDPPIVETKYDPAEDIKGINDALNRFKSAYSSRNIDKLKAEWLAVGSRANDLARIFKTQDMAILNEVCKGQPDISGTTAEWQCSESLQVQKGLAPQVHPKILTFVKQGSRWVVQDDKQP